MRKAFLLLTAVLMIFILIGCNESVDEIVVPDTPEPTPDATATPIPPDRTMIPAPPPQPVGVDKPETPVLSIEGGLFSRDNKVILEITPPDDVEGRIVYTLDGTRPNRFSDIYVGPLDLLSDERPVVILSTLFITYDGAESDLVYDKYEYEVAFEDKTVERMLMDYFKPSNGMITYSMLRDIVDFTVCGDYYKINYSAWFFDELKYDFKKDISDYDTQLVTKRGTIKTLNDFVMMRNLSMLIVDYNEVEEIPDLSEIPLEFISLKDNKIENIDGLGNMPEVQFVLLDNNLITNASRIGGNDNYMMQMLSLSNNPIEIFPVLKLNTFLKYLYMDNTGIDGWPQLDEYLYMEELDLSNNDIADMGEPPAGLRVLKMNLSDNSLSALDSLIRVETITMINNGKTTTARFHVVFESLDLSGNDLSDISRLIEMKETKSLVIQKNSIPLDMNIIEQLTWMDSIVID